ncbi:MAG: hypothetical protein D6790_10920 [Caldilineae bacterium]|nr:MAG: hypothetical protein D6790_10920 [Caldilineae bacterium]
MTESVQVQASEQGLVVRGRTKSIVGAMGLLIAGLLAFPMNFGRFFFVEAMAWTFTLWGALLLYLHIIDYTTVYVVDDEGVEVRSPLRFWKLVFRMDWGHISRMNIVVERLEADEEDVTIQVFYTPEGDVRLIREDLPYDPQLAAIIAEKAGLKPERGQAMTSFDAIPQDAKGVFVWKK